MYLFDINDSTQINLERIDGIILLGKKGSKSLAIIVGGQTYRIEEDRNDDFLKAIALIEKSTGLTKQYYAG